jgi:hypothetical protein
MVTVKVMHHTYAHLNTAARRHTRAHMCTHTRPPRCTRIPTPPPPFPVAGPGPHGRAILAGLTSGQAVLGGWAQLGPVAGGGVTEGPGGSLLCPVESCPGSVTLQLLHLSCF